MDVADAGDAALVEQRVLEPAPCAERTPQAADGQRERVGTEVGGPVVAGEAHLAEPAHVVEVQGLVELDRPSHESGGVARDEAAGHAEVYDEARVIELPDQALAVSVGRPGDSPQGRDALGAAEQRGVRPGGRSHLDQTGVDDVAVADALAAVRVEQAARGFDFGQFGQPSSRPGVSRAPMNLRSDSFRPWQYLDARLAMGRPDPTSRAAFAGNRNPHLAWENVPAGTRSLALWCVDGDAPSVGTDVNQPDRTVPIWLPRADFHHWAACDLPADLREIPEGSHSDGVTVRGKAVGSTPHGGRQGLNDYTSWFLGDATLEGRWAGYDGPFPPWNDERIHAYRFTVVALDVPKLPLADDFDGPALRKAVNGHVLGAARLTGLYAIAARAR